MNSKNALLYQRILGGISAIFFAFFAFSIGDDALQTSFSGVGLLLKFQLLIIVALALFGLWLLLSKKQQPPVVLVIDAIVFIPALIFFFAHSI